MKSKHNKLSAEEKLLLYKEFIRSNNKRQLARQWEINPTTMYCIVQECEENLLSFFKGRRRGPKGKGMPNTFENALKRIRELEKKCNHYEDEIQRFYTRRYLSETHKDKRFPLSQEEYYSRLWMMDVLQGRISAVQLESEFSGKIDVADIRILLNCVLSEPLKLRNRALVILSFLNGIPRPTIGKFLHLSLSRVEAYIEKFEKGGVKLILKRRRLERTYGEKSLSKPGSMKVTTVKIPIGVSSFSRQKKRKKGRCVQSAKVQISKALFFILSLFLFHFHASI